MQGSLHKPVIDQATQTFVDRCAELSLAVWSYDGQHVVLHDADAIRVRQRIAPHADAIGRVIRTKIDALIQAEHPIQLTDGLPAAWVRDVLGPALGYVVLPIPSDNGPAQTGTA